MKIVGQGHKLGFGYMPSKDVDCLKNDLAYRIYVFSNPTFSLAQYLEFGWLINISLAQYLEELGG